MSSEVYNTNGSDDWRVLEALCAECGHLWIAVAPVGVAEAQLECPTCHKQNSIAVLVRDA